MQEDNKYLTREAAAAYCQSKGLEHVTTKHLAKLANQGRGPEYKRLGKRTYYVPSDVDAWIAASMKPVTRGRSSVSTDAMDDI